MTLVEVAIALGLLSFAVLTFAEINSAQQKAMNQNDAARTRGLVQLKIERALNDSNSLAKTFADPSNFNLSNCMGANLAACFAVSAQPFRLVDGYGNLITGDPALYTLRGNLSANPASPGPEDVIEVRTFYTVTCPSGSCQSPQVTAHYTIGLYCNNLPVGSCDRLGFSLQTVQSPEFPVLPTTAQVASNTNGGGSGGPVPDYMVPNIAKCGVTNKGFVFPASNPYTVQAGSYTSCCQSCNLNLYNSGNFQEWSGCAPSFFSDPDVPGQCAWHD